PVGTASARRGRNDETHRLDQVRRDVTEQPVALDRRLPGDTELAGRDVAKSAMGELARPAARAAREVAALDEHDAKSARRGVQGDPGTRDAAADDEQVRRRSRADHRE